MKKLSSIILTVLLVVSIIPTGLFSITASALTSDYYTYTVSNGEATITDCSTSISGDITVPSTMGGYPVTSIGMFAFSGCRSLTSITIPNSVTKIKDAAFQNCSNLISVVLPNNITSIIGFTFENCTSLTSITIPYGVTYIGTAAFSGCANLKSIILPNSTITIYQNAFRNCTALTSMVIPQSVTRIDEYAIYECPNLKDIWYTGTQSQKVSIQISSHNDSAKSATWHYESCIIGGAHTYDDECDAICNFCDFTRNEPHKFTNACDTSCDCGYVRNVTHSYEWVIDKQANCGETGTKHEECTVCHTQYNGNTIISATGNHEYDNNCDSVCNICNFERIAPHNYDGNLDFNCNLCGLVRTITGTTGDCTWSLDGTVLTISGEGAMRNYYYSSDLPWGTDITEVIIEKGVTSVGAYAFYACRSLTSATLSNGVTIIGNNSFAHCTSLKSITIPNSIKSFGDSAFYYCSSLPGIVIPDGVTSIGNNAFYWCYKFKDITIPNSVKTIGEKAFFGCSFKSIVIPSSVISIGTGAFSCCNSLTGIEVDENNTEYYSSGNCIIKKSTKILVSGCKASVISNGVTSIGEYAFYGLDFINFTIPDSVTRIGGSAFALCDLKSITIPKSVTDIAYGAFYLCDQLTDVYYSGNRTDEAKINIGGNNEDLTGAIWHYAPCENDAHIYDYDCAMVCKNCDYIRTVEILHIYDNDCDEICNVCGEYRNPKHIFVKNGESTATCRVCNLSKTFDFIITTDETITLSYEATKEFDFVIEDTSVAKINNVSSSIISTGSYYRQSSSAKVLSVYPGETTVKVVASNGAVLATSSLLVVEGEHQLQLSEVLKEVSCTEQGKELYVCKFCDYREERTVENPGHSYSNNCDTECNICNTTRSVTHDYEWVIDKAATCGEYGEKHQKCTICQKIFNENTPVTPTGNHGYSNDCDTECNTCGYIRSVGEHQYDNSCDSACNECNHEREIEHTYTDDHICDVCGYQDYIPGDIDGVDGITDADAEYLLMHTFFPEDYPVNQTCDFNGDGKVNDADAEHLLMFTFFPEDYPIN